MMNIAVTGLRGFPNVQGGVETHCEHLYPRIVTLGAEATVFARAPYMPARVTGYRGVRLMPLACSTHRFLEAITHTFKSVIAARKSGTELIHIHAIGPSLFAPLARLLGMKVVVTTHGPDYERAKWPAPAKLFLRFCERMGMSGAHEVIAIADNIAADIQTKYWRTSTVIPNGVEIPERATSDAALKTFELERGRYILTVGRFVPEKGFHDLIEAFRMTDRRGWKLVIVGKADHEDAYSAQLRELAAATPDVVLAGFQKGQPLHELYSHAGLFVLPSYYEGLPIVLLEAMSYGLSCIASNIPANRNVPLSDDRFFVPGTVQMLAEKMSMFLQITFSNAELTAQVSMIAARYNWDAIAVQTMAVYEKALGSQKQEVRSKKLAQRQQSGKSNGENNSAGNRTRERLRQHG